MTARIIDGKAIAAELRGRVADAAHRLARDRALVPGLAVVLVGNNPASEVYVGIKTKATVGSGMRSFDHRLPATVSEADLLDAGRPAQPRPGGARHPGAAAAAPAHRRAEDPRRDRPGEGRRRLSSGQCSAGWRPGCRRSRRARRSAASFWRRPCMPSLEGLDAVIIGRSNIVGKPLALLMLAENATVTVAHSKTTDLPAVCRRADLVFAAVGRPEMVRERLDQAGRDRDRRRDHAGGGAGPRRQVEAASATSPLPRRPRSRARSRRCRAASVR